MNEPDGSPLSGGRFLPHGESFAGSPELLWVHATADVLIAAAYFTLPLALIYVTRRRRDLSFDWLIACLGVFIVACGLTHVMHLWNLWHTAYWLESAIKLIAAAAAVPTGVLLWRSLPGILTLPSRRQLRDANESLARANRELEAFTASVSHDLRSPLTTIAGQAGLLELSMPEASDEQKRRLTRIQGSVRQMSELIEALLSLSRISRHTLNRESVDVSALVESIVQDLRQKDPGRAVEITIEPRLILHGDRRLLADVFQNLIGNAWKFTSRTPQARIEIGQSLQGTMTTIYVRDNGAGFDMAYEQKLFKPFQRLHGPAEFDGSGIGLATVARIVDRHGGRIWAEGRQGAGAVFYLSLPTSPITGEFLLRHRAMA